MTDPAFRRSVGNQFNERTNTMAKVASDLARDARHFAADIIRGGPYTPAARQLAETAQQLHELCARLDGMRDIVDKLPLEED